MELDARRAAAAGSRLVVYVGLVADASANGTENDISIIDIGKGFTYNAAPIYNGRVGQDRPARNASRAPRRTSRDTATRTTAWPNASQSSYVTGSHAVKVGIQDEQVWHNAYKWVNHDINYQFLNGVPNGVVQWTTPYLDEARVKADLGIYIQDQWTIKRLTLNYGLRYSYFNAFIPPHHVDPTAFVPQARDYAPVSCVPCWNDLDPRVGAAYDLFGNGRTALKVSMGRYVGAQVVVLALANNPLSTSVNSATRSWTDMNLATLSPDCDLTNFTRERRMRPAPEQQLRQVQSHRDHATPQCDQRVGQSRLHLGFLDGSQPCAQPPDHGQRRLLPQLGNNLTITNNPALSSSDFSPYSITAPVDPRLPGGGRYTICGCSTSRSPRVVVPARRDTRRPITATTQSVNDYFGGGINARFAGGKRVGVNFEAGRKETDQCFTVFDPAQTTYVSTRENQ